MGGMSRARPAPEPVVVQRQDQIDEFCALCRTEGRFAFDTEFVMEDRYETEVCLIQVATSSQVGLLDPLGKLDLAGIWELICDPKIETIVHAGQEDLALCVRFAGKVPQSIFDVQIAAGLAGLDYPISLQKLVQATLHIRLHKAKTLTDWRRRPLTASQLRYAAEDVCHLPAVGDKLHAKLKSLDRLGWAKEEFQAFEQAGLYERAVEDRLQRVKGSGSLDARQLAVVREALHWREQLAQARNRPARSVLKDYVLIEIARQGLSTYAEIRDFRGLNLGDRDVHALVKVVRGALDLPADRLPTPKPREIETPGETILITLLTAVLRNHAAGHEIAYGLLATQKSIRELVRQFMAQGAIAGLDADLLRGWRGRVVGKMLLDVLAGRSVLRVGQTGARSMVDLLPAPSR